MNNVDDEEQFVCECCGSTEDVEWTYDPFRREFFGDEEEYLLCKRCFEDKRDDI